MPQVALSAGVQRMVRSDLGAAGVMFTLDTESGFRDVVFITFGLRAGRDRGAGLGQPGRVLRVQADAARRASPRDPARAISAPKPIKMDLRRAGRRASACGPSTCRRRSAQRFSLNDADMIELAQTGADHRGALRPRRWTSSGARTAATGKLYILQARPGDGAEPRGRHDPALHAQGTVRSARRPAAASASASAPATRASSSDVQEMARVRAGRRAGRRHDRPGLGAGDEARRGHRHQPRRPHLPRGHHRARTRHPGGGRLRRRHRRDPRRRRRSPCPARRATRATSTTGMLEYDQRSIELDALPQIPVQAS